MRPNLSASALSLTLTEFLTENPHAFTRHELVRAWSRRQLDQALATGIVTRLLTGVYCASSHAARPRVAGEALNLWQPIGAVTGALALHLYAPRLAPPPRADYVLPHGRHLDAPGWVRLHQTGPTHARIFAQSVACVEMPRALLDAWRYAAPGDRRNLLWEALWARVCTWRQLVRELERTTRVAGRRDLERVLSWFEGGATTPLEVRAQYETFADARFRDFTWQVDLRVGSRRYTVDMFHRPARLVVELDGDAHHSTRQVRDDDRERQTNLTAAGYIVVRFGWRDVFDRPAWCRKRLLQVLDYQQGRSARG